MSNLVNVILVIFVAGQFQWIKCKPTDVEVNLNSVLPNLKSNNEECAHFNEALGSCCQDNDKEGIDIKKGLESLDVNLKEIIKILRGIHSAVRPEEDQTASRTLNKESETLVDEGSKSPPPMERQSSISNRSEIETASGSVASSGASSSMSSSMSLTLPSISDSFSSSLTTSTSGSRGGASAVAMASSSAHSTSGSTGGASAVAMASSSVHSTSMSTAGGASAVAMVSSSVHSTS